MHSRLFELRKAPTKPEEWLEDDCFSETSTFGRWADYYERETDEDREDSINCLSEYVLVDPEDNSFVVSDNEQKAARKETLKKIKNFAERLQKIDGKRFVETNDLFVHVFDFENVLKDKGGFWIYDHEDYEPVPLDEWLRSCETNTKYYICATFDYHW